MTDDWRHRAACVGHDPELWFPIANDHAKEAKRICADCPVQSECLRFALGNREEYGVWAGYHVSDFRRVPMLLDLLVMGKP